MFQSVFPSSPIVFYVQASCKEPPPYNQTHVADGRGRQTHIHGTHAVNGGKKEFIYRVEEEFADVFV